MIIDASKGNLAIVVSADGSYYYEVPGPGSDVYIEAIDSRGFEILTGLAADLSGPQATA